MMGHADQRMTVWVWLKLWKLPTFLVVVVSSFLGKERTYKRYMVPTKTDGTACKCMQQSDRPAGRSVKLAVAGRGRFLFEDDDDVTVRVHHAYNRLVFVPGVG